MSCTFHIKGVNMASFWTKSTYKLFTLDFMWAGSWLKYQTRRHKAALYGRRWQMYSKHEIIDWPALWAFDEEEGGLWAEEKLLLKVLNVLHAVCCMCSEELQILLLWLPACSRTEDTLKPDQWACQYSYLNITSETLSVGTQGEFII